jgi:prohibitin 2
VVDFFKRKKNRRITPDGEPLEDIGGGGGIRGGRGGPGFSSPLRIAIPAIIAVIIIFVILSSSVKIVDAGFRGVLLKFGAVDTSASLESGIHFILPFRDQIVQFDVRTQKITEDTNAASKDLQNVATQVALNFHVDPNEVPAVYKQLGFDYSNVIIIPAIQESVKQVTAQYNAEELISKREVVKDAILQALKARLAPYHIVVDTISITDFRFSDQFVQAIEQKVVAQQRALQAQNDLQRIQIEAQQAQAKAIGEQKANVAQAQGTSQANILKAQGEAQAISTIDRQLHNSTIYLDWLKAQKWDGKLPLVTGSGGGGSNNAGAVPFINIPLGPTTNNNNTTTNSANTNAPTNSTH